jgi:hypothetical protein
MSDQFTTDFEALLRQALAPIEPPEDLSTRLQATLTSLSEAAAEELEGWELSTMRDPRNWIRPVAAVAVGTAAGAGLLVLRMRQQQKRRRAQGKSPAQIAERAMRSALRDAGRIWDR